MKRRHAADTPGFSLLESLLGMFVFLLIILGSLEFFGTARRVFFRLQEREENRQAAWAALDRVRVDVLAAGRGLARALRLGLCPGFEQNENQWILTRAGDRPSLAADPGAGGTILTVAESKEDWAGKAVCLFDQSKGETARIQSASDGILTLSSPLLNNYRAAETVAVILRTTTIYLDAGQNILRRKSDSSPAQPLLEDVHSFALTIDAGTCLAEARLSLASAPEKTYALKILARNAALGKSF